MLNLKKRTKGNNKNVSKDDRITIRCNNTVANEFRTLSFFERKDFEELLTELLKLKKDNGGKQQGITN